MKVPASLHTRIEVLLLLSPPLLGVVLGGVVAQLVVAPRFGGDEGDVQTGLALGGVAIGVLGAICVQSLRVWRGAHTDFPRLFRAAPVSALLFFFVGLALATNTLREKSVERSRLGPMRDYATGTPSDPE